MSLFKYLILLPLLLLLSCNTIQNNLHTLIQENVTGEYQKPQQSSKPFQFTPALKITSYQTFFESEQQGFKDKGSSVDIDDVLNIVTSLLLDNNQIMDSSISIPTDNNSNNGYVILITFKAKW